MKNKIIIGISIIAIAVISGVLFILLNPKDNTSLEKIVLAEVTHSVFYTPLYVAIENGYFEEEGIEIELILTPGADKVSAAVLSGDANVGFAGAESAIYIYEAGEDDYLQIFGGLTKRDGQFIVSRENIENFSLTDLENKEILIGRSSGMPALNFINSLDNVDVNTDLIELNTTVDFASLTGAFIAGTGDFVNLFEPNATLLEEQGYGYVVANVGELSGEVPYTTFYAQKSYIEDNEELLINFNKSINKALDYVNNTDTTTIAEDIINQFPDMNINDLSVMINRYKESDSWLTNSIVDEQLFNNLEDFLIKFDLLDNETDYSKLVNNLYE